jgi:hypothetical protein
LNCAGHGHGRPRLRAVPGGASTAATPSSDSAESGSPLPPARAGATCEQETESDEVTRHLARTPCAPVAHSPDHYASTPPSTCWPMTTAHLGTGRRTAKIRRLLADGRSAPQGLSRLRPAKCSRDHDGGLEGRAASVARLAPG